MDARVYVATRKGLFTLDRAGGNGGWAVAQTAFLGDSVTMVLPDPRDGAVYAAVGHGHFGVKMHRSDDGGQRWEGIAAPVYPDRPADAEPERCPVRGIEIPWSLEMVWALEPGGADQRGVLWCGTLPGGLFRPGDRGASWELIASLWEHRARKKWTGGGYDYPGIHSICVDPRDSRRVIVGVSVGGVWETTDGGETWQPRSEGMYAEYMPPEQRFVPEAQDPHRLVQCPAHPDGLWVQHHNGVFRSTDGGAGWQDVTAIAPSKFGFAVAVHPHDPNTAWFAPAIKDEQRIPVDGQVVIARTRDGGDSFEALREGLPQAHAYDLVYRHALAVDDRGASLVFGSTTGNLWASDDAGDRWALVNAHLPPVHAVRFGAEA